MIFQGFLATSPLPDIVEALMGSKSPSRRHEALPHDFAADEAGPDVGELDGKLAAALERIGHSLRVLLWEQAKAHRLSPIQVQIVLRLAHEPAPRRRVGALAAELDVTAPTVSDAVAALKRKGLLETVPVAGDRRGQQLQLSAAGARLAAALVDWQRAVTDHLGAVGADDKARTLALVLDLIGSLREAGVISVARTCPTCRFYRRDAHPGEAAIHHCALLDTAMTLADLRVDCAEHEQAPVP